MKITLRTLGRGREELKGDKDSILPAQRPWTRLAFLARFQVRDIRWLYTPFESLQTPFRHDATAFKVANLRFSAARLKTIKMLYQAV